MKAHLARSLVCGATPTSSNRQYEGQPPPHSAPLQNCSLYSENRRWPKVWQRIAWFHKSARTYTWIHISKIKVRDCSVYFETFWEVTTPFKINEDVLKVSEKCRGLASLHQRNWLWHHLKNTPRVNPNTSEARQAPVHLSSPVQSVNTTPNTSPSSLHLRPRMWSWSRVKSWRRF